jgi:hypothetical protein
MCAPKTVKRAITQDTPLRNNSIFRGGVELLLWIPCEFHQSR